MITVTLQQGSPEWHAHRAKHLNASDAPAMMGVSPYKSRSQLLDERASGITPDVDAATQRRFDDGHRSEALARPLAEQIIGDELFPCTGVNGHWSASFDGMTIDGSTLWEHKRLNKELRAAFDAMEEVAGDGSLLPAMYRIQMEHQLAVSGAERCLFMASEWDADGNLIAEFNCWYYPDLALRQRITAGWQQFQADLAEHVVKAEQAKPSGEAPDSLPALRVEVKGMVTESNLAEFKAHALAVLGGINRDLQTDEDFADAEKTVKWCKDVEGRLEVTKGQVLGQMADVDEVCRTIDAISEQTRKIRLELDRLVKGEKEVRKAELVRAGMDSLRKHYDAINATLGKYAIRIPQHSEIGAAIKGLKTLSSMKDKIDAAVANAKVEVSTFAENIRANVSLIESHDEYLDLLPDCVQLAHSNTTEDLRKLITARIAEHQKQQEEREAQRLREELRKPEPRPEPLKVEPVATPKPFPAAMRDTKINLGQINAAIAPLSITADGLAQLGFKPVAQERASKLYSADDFPRIIDAMIRKLAATTITAAA